MNKNKASVYLKLIIPVIAIITGVYVFYKIKKQNFLNSGLQTTVENKTDSLYKISNDSIYVDEAKGNLFIKNLHVKGDTARQMQLIRRGDTNAAKLVADIYIPLLKVVGFKTAHALLSKQLVCSEVVINDVKAAIYLFPGQAQHKDVTVQQKELYKKILGSLKLIQADNVIINNSEVVVKNYFTNEVKFTTSHTNIALHDVLIDSTYKQDTSRTLFCKAINADASQVMLGEKNNQAQITGLHFSTAAKVVYVSRFSYDAFKNNGFFKAALQDISVEGIGWKGPIENSSLSIKSIAVKKGVIHTLTHNKKDHSTWNDKMLTGWIKSFALDKLNIQSFTLTSNMHDKTKKPVVINNNALLLKNIHLDTISRLNENLASNIGEADFTNANLTIVSDDKFYVYKISGLRINTKAKKIWIRQAACVPRFSEEEFARRSKVQRDRYDVSLNNIECTNVDIAKLLQGELHVSTVSTHNSLVKVYRDLSYPSTGGSNLGAYPQQLLFKLKVPVNINTFTGYNNYVAYKERNAYSDSFGVVSFANSNITITNISNLTPKAGDKSTVTFTTKFLGVLPMQGSFVFDLYQWQKGTFAAEASIAKSFSAGIFNQLTQPMSLIKINSGVFDYISCKLAADNYLATGNVTMTYHDFKISLLKRKGEEIHKKNITSLLANVFIKNKNSEGGNMRVGVINKKRDVKRSFFNFIWVAIFSGGAKVFGIPGKK